MRVELLKPYKRAEMARANSLWTLRGMSTGDTAIIDRVTGAPRHAKRLADMGFVQGTRLEMLRAGTPCIVRIEGTSVGLGATHQECIELSRP